MSSGTWTAPSRPHTRPAPMARRLSASSCQHLPRRIGHAKRGPRMRRHAVARTRIRLRALGADELRQLGVNLLVAVPLRQPQRTLDLQARHQHNRIRVPAGLMEAPAPVDRFDALVTTFLLGRTDQYYRPPVHVVIHL